MTPERILKGPFPAARRAAPMAFGLVFIALGLVDALDGGRAPSLLELIGQLTIIPLVIGAGLLILPLFGWEDEWRLGRAGVCVIRRTAFHTRELDVRRAAIAAAEIVEHDWESRPATWSVKVTLLDGQRLSTPETSTRKEAETQLGWIMDAAH